MPNRLRSIRHAAKSRSTAVASSTRMAGPNTSPHIASAPSALPIKDIKEPPPSAAELPVSAVRGHAAAAWLRGVRLWGIWPALGAAGVAPSAGAAGSAGGMSGCIGANRPRLSRRSAPPLPWWRLRPAAILLNWRAVRADGCGRRSRRILSAFHAVRSQGHRQQHQPGKRHRGLRPEKRARGVQQGQRRRLNGCRPGLRPEAGAGCAVFVAAAARCAGGAAAALAGLAVALRRLSRLCIACPLGNLLRRHSHGRRSLAPAALAWRGARHPMRGSPARIVGSGRLRGAGARVERGMAPVCGVSRRCGKSMT